MPAARSTVATVVDREDELAVGAGRDAHRGHALEAAEVALEAGDAGHADQTGHDDLRGLDRVGTGVLVGDQTGQAGGEDLVGDGRDLFGGVGVRRRRSRPCAASASAASKSGVSSSIAIRGSGAVGRCTARPRRASRRRPPGATASARPSRRRPGPRRPVGDRGGIASALDDGFDLDRSAIHATLASASAASLACDHDRLVEAVELEARRLGQLLGQLGEAGRIFFGEQPLVEVGDLGLEGGDLGVDPLDPTLDGAGVDFELVLQVRLAAGDPILGLFADAGDLGLRPVADAADVLVGDAAQLGGLFGRRGVDGARWRPWPRR